MSVGEAVRRLAAPPVRLAQRGVVRARTAGWTDHSRLFAVGDLGGWSVDEDAEHIAAAARRLGYRTGSPPSGRALPRGSRCSSRATSTRSTRAGSTRRTGWARLTCTAGPVLPASPSSTSASRRFGSGGIAWTRVQVTHAEMHELVLDAGVEPERVFRIPIGIDLEHFPLGERAASGGAIGSRASRRPRSSRARSRRTVSASGRGSSRSSSRGRTRSSARSSGSRADVPELHVLLTGPARGYVRGSSSGSGSRIGTCCSHARRARPRLPRARRVPRAVAAGRGPEGRPRGDGDRRPARQRRGSARRRSSSRTGGTARSSTSRTPRRSRRLPSACTRDAALGASLGVAGPRDCGAVRARAPGRGVGGAPRRVREPWGLTGRGSGATRGRRTLGAAARARAGREPGLASSTATTAFPAPVSPSPGGTAKMQRLAARFPNRRPTSRCSTSARRGCRATCGALLWLARRRGIPIVVNQNGVGYPAWAGDADGCGQPPAAPRAARRPATSCTRASSASGGRRVPRRRPRDPGRCSTTRSTSSASLRRRSRRRAARSCSPAATRRRGLPGRARPADVRARSRRRTRRAAHRHGAPPRGSRASSSRGSASRTASTFVGRYSQAEAPSLYRRAHLLLHTQMNDSCPSVVLEAMACGLAGRASGERRHGRARRGRRRDRRRARGELGPARASALPRRWPSAVDAGLDQLPAYSPLRA